jgi:hypothetical protein
MQRPWNAGQADGRPGASQLARRTASARTMRPREQPHARGGVRRRGRKDTDGRGKGRGGIQRPEGCRLIPVPGRPGHVPVLVPVAVSGGLGRRHGPRSRGVTRYRSAMPRVPRPEGAHGPVRGAPSHMREAESHTLAGHGSAAAGQGALRGLSRRALLAAGLAGAAGAAAIPLASLAGDPRPPRALRGVTAQKSLLNTGWLFGGVYTPRSRSRTPSRNCPGGTGTPRRGRRPGSTAGTSTAPYRPAAGFSWISTVS